MNALGRRLAGPLGIAALVMIAVASARAEDDEPPPAPPPPPLVLRYYGIADFMEEEPIIPAALTIVPEKGLTPLATSVWSDDRAPGDLMPGDPRKAPLDEDYVVSACGYPGESLKELFEQWVSDEGRGSVEIVDGMLFVRKSDRAHARIARGLEGLEGMRRRVALDVQVVLLPSSDPALLTVRAGTLEEAAAVRGRPLLSERRDVLRSTRTRFVSMRRTSIVAGLRLRGRDGRLAVDPAIESLPSGVEVDVLPLALLERRKIRLIVRAAEVTIDGIEWARVVGTDIGLPSRGERSVSTTVEIADGGRAAIPLGPHGASETAVLLIGATILPARADDPRSAEAPVVGARTAPRAGEDRTADETAGRRPNPAAFLDISAVIHVDDSDTRGMSRDVLQEIVKGVTGGDESWSDGTSMEARRGVLYMINTPDVISRSAAVIAELCEQRRPRRLDAWLLRSDSVTASAGAIGAQRAEALLESAARQDGAALVARFGGGLAPRGAAYFRSLERTRFLAGVETLSGDVPSATASAQVPLVCSADAGVSLEAHLDEMGPLPGAGLSMRVALATQSLDLGRTARLTIGAGESLEARLPSIERREIGGRVTLPAEGGWALFSSGSPARDAAGACGGDLLLVRIAP